MYVYVTMINKMIFIILYIYLECIKQVALETILSLQGALTHKKVGDPCSRAYNVFLEQSPTSSEAFKQFWEEDLSTDISVETWKSCIDNIHNSSKNARLGLIQFKVVHRLHFCQSRLSKVSPEISSLCPKCSAAEGTLSHQFLTCHKLNHFWNLGHVQPRKTCAKRLLNRNGDALNTLF